MSERRCIAALKSSSLDGEMKGSLCRVYRPRKKTASMKAEGCVPKSGEEGLGKAALTRSV